MPGKEEAEKEEGVRRGAKWEKRTLPPALPSSLCGQVAGEGNQGRCEKLSF